MTDTSTIELRRIADLIRDALTSYGIEAEKDAYDQVTLLPRSGQVITLAFDVYEHGQKIDTQPQRGGSG